MLSGRQPRRSQHYHDDGNNGMYYSKNTVFIKMKQFHSLNLQTYLNLERNNSHQNILTCAATIQEPPTNQTSMHFLIRHNTKMHVQNN
jgi:hypothetical protein